MTDFEDLLLSGIGVDVGLSIMLNFIFPENTRKTGRRLTL